MDNQQEEKKDYWLVNYKVGLTMLVIVILACVFYVILLLSGHDYNDVNNYSLFGATILIVVITDLIICRNFKNKKNLLKVSLLSSIWAIIFWIFSRVSLIFGLVLAVGFIYSLLRKKKSDQQDVEKNQNLNEKKGQTDVFLQTFAIVGIVIFYANIFLFLTFIVGQGEQSYLLFIILPLLGVSFVATIYITIHKLAIKLKVSQCLLNILLTTTLITAILLLFNK
ncbi:hypothetical protein KKI23_03280 [Patescibacteria group bacterium]|nr:hypothetical protein [Patescibacteria group bacterium]